MITCPACGATSHNPVDVATGWCSACEMFTGKTEAEIRAAMLIRPVSDVYNSVAYRLRRYGVVHTIESDALWPRDERHRFRLYGRTSDEMMVLAASSDAGGIGQAIVTLHEEYDAAEWFSMQIGILDVMPDGKPSERGTWIVKPFPRGDHI